MAAITENRPAASFILSEANGQRSRENGTLVSGQNLAAGTVVMDNGEGKLTAYTALDVTDGAVDEAKGILIYAGDASAGDISVSYIARDAEVNQKLITFPAETTVGDEEEHTIASLELIGIICRD